MPCLTDAELTAVILRSPAANLDELTAHIDKCVECEFRLHQLTKQIAAVDATVTVAASQSDTWPLPAETDEIAYLRRFLGPPRTADFVGSFERYDVAREIGRGGMGLVLMAHDRALQRNVALKILAPELAVSAVSRERFQREALAAAAIGDHDYVVTIYAVGEEKGLPFLSMQYVPGGSLQQRLDEQGAMDEAEIRRIGAHTARALEFAHGNGLVHRDVKPSNILLDARSHRARLADFGLARWVGDPSLTHSGTLIGTVQYMAPEQAVGEAYDERSDLYSLGAVLYTMATGSAPVQASTPLATLRKLCDERPKSVRELNAALSDDLCDIIDCLLAKSPEDRFPSAGEVVRRLDSRGEQSSSRASIVARDDEEQSPVEEALDVSTCLGQPVGLDVGSRTVNVAQAADDGRPQAVLNAKGSPTTPAVVFAARGKLALGQDALDAAVPDASGLIEYITTRMGSADTTIRIPGLEVPAEIFYALHAQGAVDDARRQLGYFSHVCYTVPGCFGELRRRSYQDAYRIAALNTLHPINDATAVAVDFLYHSGLLNAEQPAPTKNLLVVRFGVGSFDATVMRLQEEVLTTLAILGDIGLGSRNWDERLTAHVASFLQQRYGEKVGEDAALMHLIKRECESLKSSLTEEREVNLRINLRSKTFTGTISKQFLKKVGKDLIERSVAHSTCALKEATVDWDDLDYVLLAGGAARMEEIRQTYRELTHDRCPCLLGDTAASANGAAIYAYHQMAGPESKLKFGIQETTSAAYGVAPMLNQEEYSKEGSASEVLIPKGSPLPATAKFVVRTSSSNERSLSFAIREACDAEQQSTHTIAECRVDNLPPELPARSPISCTMRVDRNGLLSLSNATLASGRKIKIELTRPHCIPPVKIEYWKNWLQSTLVAGQKIQAAKQQ